MKIELVTLNRKSFSLQKVGNTSTTPSCGGPLREQILRKVCFYEQKYDFGLVRVPFACPFEPPSLTYPLAPKTPMF